MREREKGGGGGRENQVIPGTFFRRPSTYLTQFPFPKQRDWNKLGIQFMKSLSKMLIYKSYVFFRPPWPTIGE